MGLIKSQDDYENMQKAVSDHLQKAAEKSDSKALAEAAKEADYEDDPEREELCTVVRRLVDESLDMYEDGEMSFKEMVDDLTKALQAVEAYEEEETPADEEREHGKKVK